MIGTSWELLEDHREAIVAHVRGKCPRAEDVEDCVQEAILRVGQRPDIDPTRVRALLKTVAYNVAMDMHREQGRRAKAFARIGALEPASTEVVALDLLEAQRLSGRARRLSPLERAALQGSADGYAPHETASLVGETPKSIHLALCRARKSLRALAAVGGGWLVWLRMRTRGSGRAAGSIAAMVTMSLALLAPRINSRADHATGSAGPAAGHVTIVGLGPLPSPSAHARAADGPTSGIHAVVTSESPDSASRILARANIGSPQTVHTSVTLLEVNPNQPLLVGIENCLRPHAISLDPHHAGCAG